MALDIEDALMLTNLWRGEGLKNGKAILELTLIRKNFEYIYLCSIGEEWDFDTAEEFCHSINMMYFVHRGISWYINSEFLEMAYKGDIDFPMIRKFLSAIEVAWNPNKAQ